MLAEKLLQAAAGAGCLHAVLARRKRALEEPATGLGTLPAACRIPARRFAAIPETAWDRRRYRRFPPRERQPARGWRPPRERGGSGAATGLAAAFTGSGLMMSMLPLK